jgi:hypothetical protein
MDSPALDCNDNIELEPNPCDDCCLSLLVRKLLVVHHLALLHRTGLRHVLTLLRHVHLSDQVHLLLLLLSRLVVLVVHQIRLDQWLVVLIIWVLEKRRRLVERQIVVASEDKIAIRLLLLLRHDLLDAR